MLLEFDVNYDMLIMCACCTEIFGIACLLLGNVCAGFLGSACANVLAMFVREIWLCFLDFLVVLEFWLYTLGFWALLVLGFWLLELCVCVHTVTGVFGCWKWLLCVKNIKIWCVLIAGNDERKGRNLSIFKTYKW